MRFTGVSHTSFSVTDMDRSLAFYRDLLGMRVTLDLERTGEYIEQVVGFPDARLRIVGLKLPMGSDHTLFATTEGRVRFHRSSLGRTYVSVEPPPSS